MSQAAVHVFYLRLSQWLSRPRARFEVAALVLALSMPAIAMGLIADDYDLKAAVAQDPFGAYSFAPRDPAARARQIAQGVELGSRPWWVSEHHRVAFMRPLASLSHALDFRLFPDAPWLMHVQNGLLYAAIVLLAWAVFQQLALSPVALGLAGFFYAFGGQQSMSVGWISGRNTLLAVAFGWLAVWLHLRSYVDRRASLRVLAVACAAAALLSAEGGLGALAYIAAHTLVLDPRSWKERALTLLPYAVLVIAWRIAYFVGGYGVVDSGFYRDPATDPLGFLVGVLGAIPVYLASQLTLPFASMSGVRPGSFLRIVVLSVLVLAVLSRAFWPLLREDKRARVLGLGALLAIVPLGATLPQDRLGFFVGLGATGLVAMFLESKLAPAASDGPARSRRGAQALLVMHGVVLPLLFVPMLFGSLNQFLGGGALALDAALPKRSDAHVVLLNGPSHLPVHFQRNMRSARGEQVPIVDMLYAGGGDAILERVSRDALELHVERGYFATSIESTVRDIARAPFRAGDVIERPRMRVTVLEVTEAGAPAVVRFELRDTRDTRDTPRLERVFFRWNGRQPEPFDLPEVGARVLLPGSGPI